MVVHSENLLPINQTLHRKQNNTYLNVTRLNVRLQLALSRECSVARLTRMDVVRMVDLLSPSLFSIP